MVAAQKKHKPPRFYMPVNFPEPEVERGPCARNRQIYDAVRVGLMTYRAAALEFKVAPSRVGQIVKQVELWIGRTGGGPLGSVRERVRVSEYLHRARAEACYAKLHHAFDEGVETRTDRVKIVDGKPDERSITVKTVKRDGKIIVQAWKVDEDRHRFEVGGFDTPASDLTPMERLRESGLIAAEELAAQQELDQEREVQMARDRELLANQKSDFAAAPLYPGHEYEEPDAVGQVCNLPAAEEDAEQDVEVASPSMTTDQRPMTNDQLPPGTSETQTAAGRLQTCPTAPEPEPEPEPERLVYYDPPYGPDGVTQLAKWPSPELLDLFWRPDGRGGWDWYPPRIFSTPPGSVSYHWIMPKPPFQDGPCAGRKPRPR